MTIATQLEAPVTIPSYTLQQSSAKGSTMIEVIEANGRVAERNVNFLIPHRKDYYLLFLLKKAGAATG